MKVVIGKDFVNSPLFYKRVTSHKVKIARFHGAVEHKNIVPLFCSTGIFGESEMIMVKAEGMKIPGKERKVRSDKKHRVGGPYLDDETNQKLKHIAKACDTTPPKILEEMAKYLLNHPGWVVYIQDRFNIKNDDPFRITPIIENGKVIY